MQTEIISRFHMRNAHVAVIGLGYVGLPLAVSFAQAGYQVTGIDLDRRKVEAINAGASYIEDVPSEVVHALVFDLVEAVANESLVYTYAIHSDPISGNVVVGSSNQKSKIKN